MHPNQRRDSREILIAHACVFGVVVVAFLAIVAVSVFGRVSGTFA